ncbi:unnamed protein product [Brassicogethes aeneus]|uniref:EHMT1/2 cysteine-rich region domain-containing protein n=1 Tax=Brassicogethes aeneus TaxID=1431903 RepID=A0A9P0FL39_BRAAE|nr:unnamed protein product [Brassicogethes aeneus]
MDSAINTNIEDNFINKLLGEMKNQFMGDPVEMMLTEKDKPVETTQPTPQFENSKTKNKIPSKLDTPKKQKVSKINLRKAPCKKSNIENKRSSLRRKKGLNKSVLQNAIARKEKSFNVFTKSLRSTRQLKPTPKILENLSVAKLERKLGIETKKNKMRKKNVESKISKKKKTEENESNELCSSPKEISSHMKEDKAKNEFISVAEELIASRRCLCTEPTSNFILENNNEKVFCSAIDSIDDKLIGCNRLALINRPMMRPSKRVPYVLLCEMHENRMLRHNCCPTCGIFCTQGKFAECNLNHQYHRNCQLTIADYVCCPHCGSTKLGYDIFVTLHSKRKPIYLKKQQLFN